MHDFTSRAYQIVVSEVYSYPNYGPLRDGGYYLMFLSPSRQPEPGRHEIFHGGIFEVTQDRVKPLVKTPDIVYKQSVDERRPEFIARIKKAVSER